MSASDDVQKLQALRDRGVLTEEEFARARARVSASPSPEPPGNAAVLQREVHRLQAENERIQLDHEWETERKQYMVRGPLGVYEAPTKTSIRLSFAGIGVVLLCPLVAALVGFPEMGLPPLFLLVPLVFSIMDESIKVSEYEQALQSYQQRRAELLAQAEPERRGSGAVEPGEDQR